MAHNMFAYCANNTINREDPTGYLWGWIKNVYNKVVSWFKSTPKSESTVPSSNTVITEATGAIIGITTNGIGTKKINTEYYLSGNEIKVAPLGHNEINRYPTAINSLNKVASVLTVATGSLDVANTWTANNSNTNLKRCEKMSIQLGGVTAAYGVGLLSVAAFNWWNPVGWSIGGLALSGGILFGGGMLINAAQNRLYKSWEIE